MDEHATATGADCMLRPICNVIEYFELFLIGVPCRTGLGELISLIGGFTLSPSLAISLCNGPE